MTSHYFTVESCTSLEQIPAGARIHFVGVCGVAMGQLALALKERGYRVSGSDREFYPPMSELLEDAKIPLNRSYCGENVTEEVSLFVIGNSVPYTNPEVQEIEARELPYTCLPLLLSDLVIEKRRSVVIAGTHGKTTTTASVAFLLKQIGANPSFFVGGACEQLGSGLQINGDTISIVEGDEYDSAFFAKIPKFRFYRPDLLVINALELDHVDIYSDLDAIVTEFSWLLDSMHRDGFVYACADFPEVVSLVDRYRVKFGERLILFGESERSDYRIVTRQSELERQQVVVEGRGERFSFDTKFAGVHGARNALAAILVVREFFPEKLDQLLSAMSHFVGVKRRQQVRYAGERGVLIEDFAHHPTAVDVTLSGIRERFPGHRLVAVFEPRSNSSRQEIFRASYERAFSKADTVFLRDVLARPGDENRQLIQVQDLARAMRQSGTSCRAYLDAKELGDELMRQWQNGDIVVVMSNGSFEGLAQRIEAELTA